MTKRVGAKHKIDRRLGENIWGRPKSPINKRESRPGQHGERRAGKLSDFGQQLRAKQKLKGYYANIGERQFRKLYSTATRLKGSTSEHLIGLLERRLEITRCLERRALLGCLRPRRCCHKAGRRDDGRYDQLVHAILPWPA